MEKRKQIGLILTTLLLTSVVGISWFMYKEIQVISKTRYERGEQKGARFCAECHQDIYDEWSTRSLHAAATTGDSFLNYLSKFKNNFLLNSMIGESMCYACHGLKGNHEGVNCEVCHGTFILDATVQETHERKFKPGLKDLRKPDFCAKCHELRSPVSGDLLMSLYSEWQNSQAAENGITCQECHMKPRAGRLSYHGFDTALRNEEIYGDKLNIKDIALEFPQLRATIVNYVIGHAIPASGGTRILALEISFFDLEETKSYTLVQTFGKEFVLMRLSGLFPNKLIGNTQLQSGEVRPLSFVLPPSLQGQISKVLLTLRFYSVSDEHQGDLKYAHWISEPIMRKEFIPSGTQETLSGSAPNQPIKPKR